MRIVLISRIILCILIPQQLWAQLAADAGALGETCSECEVVLGGKEVASGGTPPYTYSWSPTTGLNDATIDHPTANPEENTTYVLTVTDADGNTAQDEIFVDRGFRSEVTQVGNLYDGYGGTVLYNCYHPINRYQRYSTQEMIYTKEELGESGSLQGIKFFKVFADSNIPVENAKVYLKHTDLPYYNTYEAASNFDPTDGYTLVFSGDIANTEGVGQWVNIDFDSEFEYDNAHNLLVVVQHNGQTPDYCCFPKWAVSTTCCSMLRAHMSDYYETGPLNYMYYTCAYYRPDAQFVKEIHEPTYFTDVDVTFEADCGRFYDSGGPNHDYGKDECYVVTFFPKEANKSLGFEFLLFDIENSTDCENDWLEVYDGPDTKAPFLGRFCGTNSPGTIGSTHPTGSMTFVYNSNSSEERVGWEAVVCQYDMYIEADAGEDRTICSDCETTLGGTPAAKGGVDDDYTYLWSPAIGLNATNVANPVANPSHTQTYVLTITDGAGNSAMDQVTVTIDSPVEEVTIGDLPTWNGTTPLGSTCYPINRMVTYSNAEMLYLASEIGTSGLIHQLSFYKLYNDANTPIENVEIYMKHTTASSLSNGYVDLTSYEKVFGVVNTTIANTETERQWVTIDLDQPFHYNGSNNLLIVFGQGPQTPEGYVMNAPWWSESYTNYVPMVRSKFLNTDADVMWEVPTVGNQIMKPDIRLGFNSDVETYFTDEDVSFTIRQPGLFFSSGGPSGVSGNNESYGVVFYPENENEYVGLNFAEFGFPGTGCSGGYMEIYNGPNADAPLVGRFCGTDIPGDIVSTHETGALFIKVKTTEGLPAPDWKSSITLRIPPLRVKAGGTLYSCKGCQVKLGGSPTVTGGVGSYSYSWSPGTYLDFTSAARPRLTIPVDATETSLSYTLNVSDASGNTGSNSVTVIIDDPEKGVLIGQEGTSGTTEYPINRAKNFTMTEMLIKKEEIQFGGFIDELSLFDLETTATANELYSNVSIYLKHTDNSELTSGQAETGYRLVYSGSIFHPAAGGKVTIPFDYSFEYNAEKDLQIGIRYEQAAGDPVYPKWKTSSTGNYRYTRTVSLDEKNEEATLVAKTNRPDMELHFNNGQNRRVDKATYAESGLRPNGAAYSTDYYGWIYFLHQEDYAVPKLNELSYFLYDHKGNKIENLPALLSKKGTNYLKINIRDLKKQGANIQDEGIYLLEKRDAKGHRSYLKVQYYDQKKPPVPPPGTGPATDPKELTPGVVIPSGSSN